MCKGKGVNNIAKGLRAGQIDGKNNFKCRGGIFANKLLRLGCLNSRGLYGCEGLEQITGSQQITAYLVDPGD